MSASPTPDPSQQQQTPPPDAGGAASPDGGAQPSPSSAPANPMQMLLARWSQTAQQMAASDPKLAAGAQKIREGIQDMQTALISPGQPSSPQQSAQ